MIIVAELNELKDGMPKAYENFERKANREIIEKTMFYYTKIEVSKETDDYFWKYYKDFVKNNNQNLTDEEIKIPIAM